METSRARPEQHLCRSTAWRTLAPDDVESSIGERFRAQVEIHPGCLALDDGQVALTYDELEGWANAIAQGLEGAGVPVGARVVQVLHQGAAAVASTLGTLLVGAVHVPLDPDEPDERLLSLLDRVRPVAVVTDDMGAARLARQGADAPVVLAAERRATLRPSRTVGPDALATAYLTSGSTGAPKGVLDLHRNIVHNALRYTLALDITPADRLSMVQSPSSSAVMSSTFAALLNGAALLPYRVDAASLGSLAAWVRSERITIYHSVPSILRRALAFDGVLPDVRVVRLEGDRSLGQDMATWRRHFRPGTLIANGLGTTETGLCRQLVVPVEQELDDGLMPVGYPVTDMDASVVGERGDPLPPDEVGEIAVTSRYLAIGYLDDDASTASAFAPVPGRPGLRTYRTGDLGRLRGDGCLEYLGRSDGQSKVLGHRVQPAEIEAALATMPGVEAVAVRVIDDAMGEGRVVAWVVGDAGSDEAALRAGAQSRLPAHMRPARYVHVTTLPSAAGGKVDRAALLEPAGRIADASSLATDPLETQVLAVVRRVLGHPVGRDDDFFAVGGDSLAAVDVVLALERATGRRLPPSLLLGAPTVARLTRVLADGWLDPRASRMSSAASGAGTPLVLVPSHHGHPLAYAALARHLEGTRPVLASDVSGMAIDGDRFETIARRHVEALVNARPSGRYHLGGFCFGGAIAYEMARQLIEAGDPPAGLYLLGVSPYDLPDLVPAPDLERWERSVSPVGKLGRAMRFVGGMAGPVGRGYLADRARQQGRSLWRRRSPDGRDQHRARSRRNAQSRPSVGRYRGPALPIPVTLILPSWSLAAYTSDPTALWAAVGATVDVHVVPGVERMLLREPVVSDVARILAVDPGA